MEEILEEQDDNSVDKNQILAALNHVQDPDLGRSIVELGFIKNLRACGGNVAFDIELTTPACPVKEQMQEQARTMVLQVEGVQKCRCHDDCAHARSWWIFAAAFRA